MNSESASVADFDLTPGLAIDVPFSGDSLYILALLYRWAACIKEVGLWGESCAVPPLRYFRLATFVTWLGTIAP